MTVDSRYFPQLKATDDDTRYTFEFETIDAAAVEVWLVDGSGRAIIPNGSTDLTYTVNLDPYLTNLSKRGEVVLNRALTSDERIEIFRNTPIIKTYTGVPLEAFDSDAFEQQLDRICLIEQEIEGHACDCRDDYTSEPVPCPGYECDSWANWASTYYSAITTFAEYNGASVIPATTGPWTTNPAEAGTTLNDSGSSRHQRRTAGGIDTCEGPAHIYLFENTNNRSPFTYTRSGTDGAIDFAMLTFGQWRSDTSGGWAHIVTASGSNLAWTDINNVSQNKAYDYAIRYETDGNLGVYFDSQFRAAVNLPTLDNDDTAVAVFRMEGPTNFRQEETDPVFNPGRYTLFGTWSWYIEVLSEKGVNVTLEGSEERDLAAMRDIYGLGYTWTPHDGEVLYDGFSAQIFAQGSQTAGASLAAARDALEEALRNRVGYIPPNDCDSENPTRPDPECKPYSCSSLTDAAFIWCSSYWGLDDSSAPSGTVTDEIGSNIWTVTAAFDASTQPGIYGADDCDGTYQSNSTTGSMTYDQTIPAQWFGVVVTGTAATVFAVFNGTDDVTHTVTGDSVLVTWKITDSGISVYEDSLLAATYPAASYTNLRLQAHGAGFAHGFLTDDAGVVEMRLAHNQNFLAYNTGQAPTYCKDSENNTGGDDPDDDGYLCVSPCYK